MAIKVETFIDTSKAMAAAELNEADIRQEIIKQPGHVAFYTTQAAHADRQVARLKLKLELKEAETSSRIREEAKVSGDKLTVDAIKEKVRLDKEVTEIEIAKIDAEEVAASLRAIVSALKDKSTSLVTLSNMDRDMMKSRITVMDDTATRTNSGVSERDRKLKESLAA